MKWHHSSAVVRWLAFATLSAGVACQGRTSEELTEDAGFAGVRDAGAGDGSAHVSSADGAGAGGALYGAGGSSGMGAAGDAATGSSQLANIEPGTWCPLLARPPHLSITVENGAAIYTCLSAYAVADAASVDGGIVKRECLDDGTWSGSEPQCLPVDCGAPPAPDHGTAQPSLAGFTKPGANAVSTCQAGYYLMGDAIRTCQLDGTWSGVTPQCKELSECPALTAPANGSIVVSSRAVGATATYSCGNGYELAGAVSRSCQPNLKWSGSTPTCYPKPPPSRSCQAEGPGSAKNCGGDNGTDDCCASLLVPGGTFKRDNDPTYPATVSDFRLDKYQVTVARFRAFVLSDGGIQKNHPATGAGANPNIAGSGWREEWNSQLAVDRTAVEKMLACSEEYRNLQLYTYGSDRLPINCVNWYEAFAFCIWDGGRLPTELEWNYAAAGGDEQREYPWGSQKPENTYAIYAYGYCGEKCPEPRKNVAPVGSCPKGNGRWGQADLVGNMYQWVFDAYGSAYPTTCTNCAAVPQESSRVIRGGCYFSPKEYLVTPRVGASFDVAASETQPGTGLRCARNP